MTNEDLSARIDALELRNKKVAADKEWETSAQRRIAVTALTYLVISLFLTAIDVQRPWINAIVPCLGFLLSTLTVGALKARWMHSKGF